LCHVFSHRWVSAHVKCETVDGRMFAAIEESECFLVTGCNPAQQAQLREICGSDHAQIVGRPATVSGSRQIIAVEAGKSSQILG